MVVRTCLHKRLRVTFSSWGRPHADMPSACRGTELKRVLCVLQVATEWLFSVPEHVLEKHLGSDPSTPTADADTSDEVKRSYAPRRSTLNVSPR